MTDVAADKLTIRELVENWAVYRDARLWDRFRAVWHAEGRMMATWFQGNFEEFIKVNDEGWARGVRILHFLGGSAIAEPPTKCRMRTPRAQPSSLTLIVRKRPPQN